MEFTDTSQQHICRICTQSELIVDWNEKLFKFNGMSYKDCYYKYTHLEELVSDPLPPFLCEECSTNLKNIHVFIEKAIETRKVLERNLTSSLECLVGVEKDEFPEESTNGSNHEIECVYMVANDDLFSESKEMKPDISEEENEVLETILLEPKKCKRNARRLEQRNLNMFSASEEDSLNEDGKLVMSLKSSVKVRVSKKEKEIPNNAKELDIDHNNVKAKTKKNTPVMCSYCSKIIHNAYYLKKHEQTHKADRERDITCSQCGLKTFTKTALYIHMKIHDKNREKKFKCEFCDKAFFHRGACNVHRRIHLGQMVKCPLCPKEFCRQVDLDKHMPSHSHTALHSNKPNSKLKYVVHCKYCNKEISSAKFNAHRAAHMNEPLMRCTACEKDFFSRVSCTRHMRRVHNRTKDNYDDITTYYERYRPRLSHVLMEQQEEVEAKG